MCLCVISVCAYVSTCVYLCMCMYVVMGVFVYVRMCVCVYVCVFSCSSEWVVFFALPVGADLARSRGGGPFVFWRMGSVLSTFVCSTDHSK